MKHRSPRKKLIRFRFTQQLTLCFGLFLCNGLLAHGLGCGWFHNLSWVLSGLLFLVNPVLPEPWHDFHSDALRREARIAGAVLLFIGLVVRFGP